MISSPYYCSWCALSPSGCEKLGNFENSLLNASSKFWQLVDWFGFVASTTPSNASQLELALFDCFRFDWRCCSWGCLFSIWFKSAPADWKGRSQNERTPVVGRDWTEFLVCVVIKVPLSTNAPYYDNTHVTWVSGAPCPVTNYVTYRGFLISHIIWF